MSRTLEVFLLAAGLTACATSKPRPPPVQTFRLGLLRADYRDYRTGDICAAEPRWLVEELQAPLAIVNRFVKAASQAPDSEWSDETAAFVRDAAASLPPLLDTLGWNLSAARRCSFSSKPSLAALLQRGPPACDAARRTIPEVSPLLDYVQARRARAAWRSERTTRESHAAQLCARKDSSIYYAVQSCDGSREWVFCDGARVTAALEKEPEWTPPLASAAPEADKPARRKRAPAPPDPAHYLAAAKAFNDLDSCPALPPRPAIAPSASPR